MVRRRVVGAGAGDLSFPCGHGWGTKLRGQVVRGWWYWGQEAGQGVLIIALGTLVLLFNRCPGQLAMPVSCSDQQWYYSDIHIVLQNGDGRKRGKCSDSFFQCPRAHSSHVHTTK